MADHNHLETFAEGQESQLATAILKEFASCCRGGDVPQIEYAQRLRLILDARFAEEVGDA